MQPTRLIRVQPIGCSMARTRIPCGHPGRTPRAWCKISSTRFLLRTSVFTTADGRARWRFGSSPCPRPWQVWTWGSMPVDSASCIGTRPANGPSCFTGQHGLRPSTWTAKVSSPTWTKMIFGSFRREFLTPFKVSIPTDASSCWFLTTVTFRSQKRFCWATRWRTCRLKCWQKISLSANRRSRMSRNKNYSFFKLIYQVHWKPTKRQPPGRAEGRHRTLCFARWKCRRRRKRKVARCALLIQAISKSQPRRWHWLPFIPAG
jgi:hypothetical protein